MAVCSSGVSFWVGCIRSHGGQQLIPKYSWSVWQTALKGNYRPLRSASWALAFPNRPCYQSIQKPPLSAPLWPSAHQRSDEDWEEMVSMYLLLKPRGSEEQQLVAKVPLVGQVNLSELLALGANKAAEFSFMLTTVDGRREDDISIVGKSRTGIKPGLEHSSFRSLFEAEGCPAPFRLGSGFFCFHCPGTEPVPEAGALLRMEPQTTKLQCSPTVLWSQAKAKHTERGYGENDTDNEEKLALMYEKLRTELPLFFVKNHDFGMYSSDVEFINGLLNMKSRGRVTYQLTLILWRMLCLCYYTDAKLEILKLTKHPEERSIKARWRVRGLPFHTLLLRFYKKDKSQFYRTFDAFSTFYLGADGLIHCHKVEKVMRAQPPVLPKVTTLLAGALVALGFQEDRPALNLLPLFLSSLRQTRH